MSIAVVGSEALGSYSPNTFNDIALTIPVSTNWLVIAVASSDNGANTTWGTVDLGGVSGTLRGFVDVGSAGSVAFYWFPDISARVDDDASSTGTSGDVASVGVLYGSAITPTSEVADDWSNAKSTLTTGTKIEHTVTQPSGDGNGTWVALHAMAADAGSWTLLGGGVNLASTSYGGDNQEIQYRVDTASREFGWQSNGLTFWAGASGMVIYDLSTDIELALTPGVINVNEVAITFTGADLLHFALVAEKVVVKDVRPLVQFPPSRQIATVGEKETPGRVDNPPTSGYLLTFNGYRPVWGTIPNLTSGIHTEIVMAETITSPPEPVWTEDGTDYVYEEPS